MKQSNLTESEAVQAFVNDDWRTGVDLLSTLSLERLTRLYNSVDNLVGALNDAMREKRSDLPEPR